MTGSRSTRSCRPPERGAVRMSAAAVLRDAYYLTIFRFLGTGFAHEQGA